MSISSAIQNAQTKVANAYTAVEGKGGTLPSTQNLSNLPTAISSIPSGGGNLQAKTLTAGSTLATMTTILPDSTFDGLSSATVDLTYVENYLEDIKGANAGTFANLTVTPSTTAQTIVPTGTTLGYSQVECSAVTSAIDNNIQAGNIKSGTTILGVTGTVTALVGETRTVSITSSSGNTFTPSSGKNGITSIKCNPTNKALTITPSKTAQTLSVPSGYSGYGTVKCNAVTSSIDSNIIAGNIKSGVSILGVTGNYTGSGGGGGSYTVINTTDITLEDTGEGSVDLFGELLDGTEFYLVLNNNSPVAYYTVSDNYINVCDDGTQGFLTFSYMSDTASYNGSSNDFSVTCIARYNSSTGYAIFNLHASF